MEEHNEKFSKERRSSPRVSGAIAEYTIEGNDSPKKKAFIKDICIHGVCIYVPEAMDNDLILCLDIFLFGSEDPIEVKGKISWQKEGEYFGYQNIGVEFTEINDENKKILEDHINSNYRKAKENGTS